MKQIDLLNLRSSIEKGEVSVDEASEFMMTPYAKDLIRKYLAYYDEERPLDNNELTELTNLLEGALYIYTYSGDNTGMTDSEYDKLMGYLNGYLADDIVTLPTIKETETEHHRYPLLRGTLTKIHYLKHTEEKVNQSRRTLDQWIASTEDLYYEMTGERIDLKSTDAYVFPKWDGVSVVFEFDKSGKIDKALTRGYTKFNTAENVRQHFSGFERPLNGLPYGLKTEIMVTEDGLLEYNEKYRKDYKQSRAIASGIINSDDAGVKDDYLQIIQLRYMEEGDTIERLCPEVFNHPYIKCKLGDVDAIEEFAQQHRFVNGLRCDGAVIHIIDKHIQEVLGRKNDKNNFEVAYKFTEEYAITKVKDIEFQLGLFGRVTPVVKVKPVVIKGNTIESATLGSIQRMRMMDLAKGDTIKILYDIIPYASYDEDCERSGKDPIQPPEFCPECGKRLTMDGAIWSCQNPECACRKKGKILNYLTKMNIKGMSYETIGTLYDNGFIDGIEDLYKMVSNYHKLRSLWKVEERLRGQLRVAMENDNKHSVKKLKEKIDKVKKMCKPLEEIELAIIEIPGFGEGKYRTWIEGIDSVREVSAARLLGAIGIAGCGEKTFEQIVNWFTIEQLIGTSKKGDPEFLTHIPGVGDKKANLILEGIEENKKLIEFLTGEMVEIKYNSHGDVKFKVCFTKIRDEDVEKYIESLGGQVVDRVTADTNILVVPQLNVESSKTRDAVKKGVKIVPIDDIFTILEKEYDK